MTRIRFDSETALNVPNINDLNNVVISATEPTTGEEVWIQKGKNLFNINNLSLKTGSVDKVLGTITVNQYNNSSHQTLKNLAPDLVAGKTYIISANTTSNERFVYLEGSKSTWKYGTPRTITQEELDNVVIFYGKYQSTDTVVISEIQIELEQGETATSYEPYVDKKIYTKNGNGDYEEFYNETNREVYSTSEQRIGTWLGKPLYRKVKVFTPTEKNANFGGIGELHVERVISAKGMAYRPSSGYYNLIPCNFVGWEIYLYDITENYGRLVFSDNAWTSGVGECILIFEYTKKID